MDTLICPKGHQSSDSDYCSECGAKIGNGIGNGSAIANGAAAVNVAAMDADVCPDCGTVRDHKGVAFCEICGYNFLTGARGEVPVNFYAAQVAPPPPPPLSVAAPPPLPPPPIVLEAQSVEALAIEQDEVLADEVPEPVEAEQAAWSVEVSIDQAHAQPESPEPPADFVPFVVAMDKPVSLIGRTSQTRAIFPEIAMDHDDAVSHRHALLQLDSDGALLLRDIGAANGTMVNGKEIKATVDYILQDGDEITLGHWSRITIKGGVDGAEA